MFDTREFVATRESAGATEEQATIALKAFPKALDTDKEGLVSKDAMTDLKLFIGTQIADIKNLQFIVLATWSVLIAAIGLMVKHLLP
jgi:hypothetical protein